MSALALVGYQDPPTLSPPLTLVRTYSRVCNKGMMTCRRSSLSAWKTGDRGAFTGLGLEGGSPHPSRMQLGGVGWAGDGVEGKHPTTPRGGKGAQAAPVREGWVRREHRGGSWLREPGGRGAPTQGRSWCQAAGQPPHMEASLNAASPKWLQRRALGGVGDHSGWYGNNSETFLIGMHLCLSAFSVPASGGCSCVAMA